MMMVVLGEWDKLVGRCARSLRDVDDEVDDFSLNYGPTGLQRLDKTVEYAEKYGMKL